MRISSYKLFENVSGFYLNNIEKSFNHYNKSIEDLTNARNLEVKKNLQEYKLSIDDCLYDLTDNFFHSVEYNDNIHSLKFPLASPQLPDYRIAFEFDIDKLSLFIEEFSSVMYKLGSLDVSASIRLYAISKSDARKLGDGLGEWQNAAFSSKVVSSQDFENVSNFIEVVSKMFNNLGFKPNVTRYKFLGVVIKIYDK